jgi:hypothetical protein
MVNAHAEISDPAHPAYAVIAGQKEWMLALFAELSGDDELARTLMLLHEGALVAHGLRVFPDPIGHAAEGANVLLGARAPRRTDPGHWRKMRSSMIG